MVSREIFIKKNRYKEPAVLGQKSIFQTSPPLPKVHEHIVHFLLTMSNNMSQYMDIMDMQVTTEMNTMQTDAEAKSTRNVGRNPRPCVGCKKRRMKVYIFLQIKDELAV